MEDLRRKAYLQGKEAVQANNETNFFWFMVINSGIKAGIFNDTEQSEPFMQGVKDAMEEDDN